MTVPGSLDLTHRRVLVVGGSAGIGYACAETVLAAGARVVIAGRNEERGRAAADALGCDRALGDASDPAAARRMVNEAAGRLGGLDAILCCAGGDPMPRLLKDIPLDQLIGEVTTSLAPVILPARAAYDVMAAEGGGAIVLVASDAGKLATPGEAAIGAAMAGIIMFARAWRSRPSARESA